MGACVRIELIQQGVGPGLRTQACPRQQHGDQLKGADRPAGSIESTPIEMQGAMVGPFGAIPQDEALKGNDEDPSGWTSAKEGGTNKSFEGRVLVVFYLRGDGRGAS